MQIGLGIQLPSLVSEEKHDEKTCPWHNKKSQGKSKIMDEAAPDTDTDVMPENLGTKLGKNLGERPEGEVEIEYKPGAIIKWEQGKKKKEKTVQTYEKDSGESYTYSLQYAPHHLIPGNESLKNSPVVPFLGDKNAIKNFGSTSHIKDGKATGYDVNDASNGVWLPSPYALSNSNKWPSIDGIKVVKRRSGAKIAEETEALKMAYVAASIEITKRQFHMRHADYSAEVEKALNAIGDRLFIMAGGECPIASSSQDSGKIDPPMGLPSRLTMLSNNLRRLLVGTVWRSPIFTDELTKKYANERLTKSKKTGRVKKVL